jgi:SNF2 family DNA or RNA helicase
VRIFGKVSLEGRTWIIETEPQVALRLKRVFERINKNQYGKLTLSASPTNSRELSWFLQRYPMEMSKGDQERLQELTQDHLANEELVGKVLAGDYKAPSFELAVQPRDYQRISADLAMKTGRLLIADDVGLGKTAQAICTFTDPSNLPALVVTLAHLPKQWAKEIEKFLPKLRTHIIKKGQPYDVCKGKKGEKTLFPDVLIINYHKLAGWAETLSGVVKTVVYDEIQELRRSESGKYGAATHISEQCNLCIGLSATPIYNYGGEIFNVISSLEPGVLGMKDEFVREWCDSYMADRPKIRDPKAFGSFLREQGLMIRRTRSEVGRELEALTKIPQAIEADPEALSRIEDSAAELAKIILSQNTLKKGVKMQASEQLSNLVRQATGIAKAPYVADFVRMLAEADEPILLYAWHREVYSILEAKLRDLNPVMYTGSESANQKQEAKDKFLSGEAKILMMSLRAGAGLDGLQHHCRTVVFGELDWSPGVHDQCIGRVHRDGQKDPVMAYFLLSDYGSDPVMSDVLGVKRAQMSGIRDPNAELIEASQGSDHDLKKLAESFLRQRGLEVTEPTNLSNIIQLRPKKDEQPEATD